MEICQICVVDTNLNWERGTLEVVTPGAESMDNHKEFSIVDIIDSFGKGEQLGEVGAGVPVSIGVSLQEDTSGGVLGGIGGDGKGMGEVWEAENWLGEEKFLETFKGSLTSRGPGPGAALLGKIEERAGDIGKSGMNCQ